MADKSDHILERLPFHPCDVPRGMEPYDLNCLTRVQQLRLDNHKIEVVRENQKYLYKTPEIRAVIQIIIRKLLLDRPSHDIQQFIGEYFRDNWQTILKEINEYVEKCPRKPSPIDFKKKALTTEDKRVTMEAAISDEESAREEELLYGSFEDLTSIKIVKDILDEIVDNVVHEYETLPSKRIRRSDQTEVQQVHRDLSREKSEKSIDDEELFFDFGLDFDLDFSGYHEEDDPNLEAIESSDNKIGLAGRLTSNHPGNA